jgi:hypothetical protein
MTSTVTIYHGYEADGRMVFPLDTSALPELLVEKYSYHTDDRTSLDDIYRDNNAVDGSEWNVQFEARSLSIGDIIGFRTSIKDGSVWRTPEIYTVVDSFGFTPVSADRFDSITKTTEEDIKDRRFELNRRYAEREYHG